MELTEQDEAYLNQAWGLTEQDEAYLDRIWSLTAPRLAEIYDQAIESLERIPHRRNPLKKPI
jgi:hypothetical protein